MFQAIWSCQSVEGGVRLSLTSPDGDEGFPGELRATVTYILAEDTLNIQYQACSSKTTPINLTNHSYFNLAGHVRKRLPASAHINTLSLNNQRKHHICQNPGSSSKFFSHLISVPWPSSRLYAGTYGPHYSSKTGSFILFALKNVV